MSEDKSIKVTDKRMFTPDGELRDDYRDLEKRAPAGDAAAGGGGAESAPEATEPAAPPEEASAPAPEVPPAEGDEARPRLELPRSGGPGAPGFAELVSVLIEPVALYLGDAQLPEGESMENLEAARFYIDLLDVLRDKTAGNLTAQESRMLDELLYQIRLRYVQKRG